MPPHRIQTPHRPVTLLCAGEYRKGRTYKVWRPRGTSDWLLILTVGGEGFAKSGSHTVVMRERSLVLFRPDTSQEYGVPESGKTPLWHFLWAHFSPSADYLPWLAWPEVSPGFFHIPALPEQTHAVATSALQDANSYLKSALSDQEALAMNALERAILHIGAYCREHASAVDPRLRRVAHFISRNLHRPLTLKDLAAAGGMSVSHFCHIFPKQMGKPPLAFVEHSRMRQAATRLRLEDDSIAEIAYSLGYSSPFYFTNRFRKFSGSSPSAYRKKMRAEANIR